MKKGFTLIELLAVIVILAIIALIATPIVLNIINDAKESAVLRSADFYVDALENEIMLENMKQGGSFNPNTCTITNGTVSCDGKEITLKADGEMPSSGSITFEEGKVKDVNLTYTNGKVTQNNKGELVLGDTNIPEPKSFAADDWSTIVANVRAGNLSKYNVGDTKEIALTGFTNGETGSNGLYTVRIANTSTPEECSTSGFSQTACGFVIEFVDIISKHNMNPVGEYKGTQYDYGWNVDGYPASSMYTYIQNDIYNSLPEELKSNIIDTYVVSGRESGKTTNYKTTDKLYLLSTAEVWAQGTDTGNQIKYDTARDVTRQLDYYKNYENEDGSIGVTTDNHSAAKKKYNGSADFWWLRSAISGNTYEFCYVDNIGDWLVVDAGNTSGVAVAFRIG